MATPISFTGLGSGIDLAGIVDSMVEAERQRYIAPFESWKTQWTDKVSGFQELNTKLAALHTQVKALDTPAEFLTKNTASSDDTVLTASSSSSALNGSHTVVINQLAQSETEVHDSGFADEDSTAVTSADGTFSYTYNGVSRTINVTAGTTLSGLKNLINNDSQNPGVTASILDDGDGTDPHHLVISGNSTGADYTISNFSETLDNFDSSAFVESQTAQNAEIRVDGYPAAPAYLERQSNTFNDVISGITMTLLNTGTATVTVTTDTESILENVGNFITAFNDVRDYVQQQTSYNADTDTAGILLGNYAVDTIKNRLNKLVAEPPPGFRDGTDTYTSLMQIGIYTDADAGSETEGQLILDQSELNAALESDAQAVADLFSKYYAGSSAHDDLDYVSHITGITEAGTYEVRFVKGATENSGMMRLKGTSQWHAAAWDNTEQTLTGTAGTPEAGLVVKVTNTAASFTGEVDLKLGFAGALKEELDFLTHSSNGPLAVLESNYQDIIDHIDNKIAYEEDRIALYEQRLTERFARLEQVLSELNGQSSYLAMKVNQLS